MSELLHLENRIAADRYRKGEAGAPRPRPSRRNAVYGGEHNDYHHRRHTNDASNSEFIAANIVNAYKLEKARRKVDAALKAEDAADVVDTRSAEYHAQQPRTQKAKKDSQSAKVKGKREKPARQPFLRSEAQQEVALRVAAQQKTDAVQARSEQALAWAERSLETSNQKSMAQAHYDYSSVVLKEMTTVKATNAPASTKPTDTPTTEPPAAAPTTTPMTAPLMTPPMTPAAMLPGMVPNRTGTWRDYL